MNLFARIKNLFQKHQESSANLVSMEYSIKIPSRKEFNNDTLIDYYKDEYKTTLSSMKDYDTLFLEADDLNNKIKMASDLLFVIAMKEEPLKEKSADDRINYLINSEKLELYYQDINKLQAEVTARLIALKEIKKEYFLRKRQKESLNNVINRLSMSFQLLLSQQISILSSIVRYKNESKYNYEPSEEEQKQEYIVLEEKIKHLNWLQQVLPTSERVIIRDDIRYLLIDIATLEKKLEEYTYTHKDEITVESKNNEIDDLLKIAFDMEHKEELLKRIEQVERKYRLFYEYRDSLEYGDIAVDESDLTNIYNLKFSALTISKEGILNTSDNLNTLYTPDTPDARDTLVSLNISDKIELHYYENIIFSMLQDIIMGRNEIFNEVFSSDKEKATKLLIAYLKEDTEEINYQKILQTGFLLDMILAFNNKDGFNNLCDNIKLECNFSSRGDSKWHQFLPLSTIAILSHYDLNFIRIIDGWQFPAFPPFNELYYLYKKNHIDNDAYFHFPYGIKKLYITNYTITNSKAEVNNSAERKMIDALLKDAKDKILVFPDSLEEIETFEVENNEIKGIILNKNLKKLYSLALANQSFEEINIPSSLEAIAISSFQDCNNLHTIRFDNFHKSALFKKDNVQLENLFYQLYQFIRMAYEMITVKQSIKKFIFTFDDMESIEVPASFCYISGLNNKVKLDFLTPNISKNDEVIQNMDKTFDALRYFAANFKNKFYELLLQKRDYYMRLQQVLPEDRQIHISSDPQELVNDIKRVKDNLKWYTNSNEEKEERIREELYAIRKLSINWEDLKIKILVFLEYSNKHILTEDDLEYLYYLQFRSLAFSKELVETFFDNQLPEEDLKYYKRAVLKTINYDNQLNKDYKNLIINILKDGNKDIEPEKILTNFYLFNIFLCLINPYHIFYFSGEKISTENLSLSNFKIFEFENDIYLRDLCEIYQYTQENYLVKLYHKGQEYVLNKDFYDLYNTKIKVAEHEEYEKPDVELVYFFPNGIRKINAENLNGGNILKAEKNLLRQIREKVKEEFVVFPHSLRVINGNIFGNIKIKDAIFFDGITTIKGDAFLNQDFTSLYMPASITTLGDDAFDYDKIEELDFFNIAPNKITELTFLIKFFKRVRVVDPQKEYVLETNLKEINFHYNDSNKEIAKKISIDIQRILDEECYNIGYCINSDDDLLKIILGRIKTIVKDKLGNDNIKRQKNRSRLTSIFR